MELGYYWVWFYNRTEPLVMRWNGSRFENLASDCLVSDEIDFTDRPPRLIKPPII